MRRRTRPENRVVLVSAVMIRAGLAAGAGRRCRQVAMTAGAAVATITVTAVSVQPITTDWPVLDIRATAMAAPTMAAARAASPADLASMTAIWRPEAPRARSMISSSWR